MDILGEPTHRPLRRKIPAVKSPGSSNRGKTTSAHSLGSQWSSGSSPSTEQTPSDQKRSLRKSSQSSTSSSSYSKRVPVLEVSDGSSSSNPDRQPSIMSKRKANDLLSNLGDLPSSEVGKAPPKVPSSALGKRSATDPSPNLGPRKAKGKPSTKPTDDPDLISAWLEGPLPPFPP